MDTRGNLDAGDYIKMPNGEVWYVDSVTNSGAHCIPLSGRRGLIRTSKRKGSKTKEVVRHLNRHVVITRQAGVELVDPETLDLPLMRRRVAMARKQSEAGESEQTTEAAAPAAEKERQTQKYVLTAKAPKEMKGQGKQVYDALKAHGKPVNIKELTELVQAASPLQTRQDPERVVGFYCSKFKREGLVDVQKTEASAGEPAAAAV
jgi:hypothetical protein